MSRIDEILLMVKHVPPFPKVAQRVLAILDQPGTKAADLAEVIRYDAAITTNILKICNAAYFGLSRKVTSLEEALVLIGTKELKDVVITSSSSKFYKGKVAAGYDLDQGDLWRHSVATAIVAKLLAPKVKGADPSAAFTSGLLHDIGKRFLSTFVGSEMKHITALVDEKNYSFVEAETEVLGASHAELGARILESWEFDESMVAAVREHHDADVFGKSPLSSLIALSNTVVVSLGIGGGADGLALKIQSEGLAKFGITATDIETCMESLLIELDKAEEILNL